MHADITTDYLDRSPYMTGNYRCHVGSQTAITQYSIDAFNLFLIQ